MNNLIPKYIKDDPDIATCKHSKYDGEDIQFCNNNLELVQIFITYCKSNPKESPKEYYLRKMNEPVTTTTLTSTTSSTSWGDCPERTHIFLYRDESNIGTFNKKWLLEPEQATDRKGKVINLKDLSYDIGIDVNLNGENIRMDDVSKSELPNIIKENCETYKLIINTNPVCYFYITLGEII